VCEATPKDCAAVGDQCNLGTCEAATGICKTQPIPDGRQCDDGDPCTTADSCQKGVCLSTNNTCKDEGCGCGTPPVNSAMVFGFLLLVAAWIFGRRSE
jgi:uncharacterized protein (TIGR03382 family)